MLLLAVGCCLEIPQIFKRGLCSGTGLKPLCNLQHPGDTNLQGGVWASTPGALGTKECGPPGTKYFTGKVKDPIVLHSGLAAGLQRALQ